MRKGFTSARGMTLIEVLMVLVLIGVITALASLSLDLGGPAAKAEQEARRLARLVQLQCEEALLMSRELGLTLESDGYRFSAWDGEAWRRRDDAREFESHLLSPPLTLRAVLDGRELPLRGEDERPQVVCASSGELTPFRVFFTLPGDDRAFEVTGELDGTVSLAGWAGPT